MSVTALALAAASGALATAAICLALRGVARIAAAAPDAAAARPQVDQLQHQLDLARATEAERRRLYDDLHDDVGGKLLTLLHQVPEAQQALVRDVLQDIRDIVARSRSLAGSLLEVLALLREESERRLDAQGIALDWRQAPTVPDPPLDDAQAMHLFRIGRESVTNALRHARPQRLRVVIDSVVGELVFEVTDDGSFAGERIGSGRGTRSMQHRADALQGDIDWLPGTQGGTKVRLRFPLPAPTPQARDGR